LNIIKILLENYIFEGIFEYFMYFKQIECGHMKNFCYCLIWLLWIPVISQDLSQRILEKLDDEELLRLFDEVVNDSVEAETVARVYLKRAKHEKDTIKMARGYDRLARIFHPKKNKWCWVLEPLLGKNPLRALFRACA